MLIYVMFLPYCSRDCIQAIFSIDFNCLTQPIENKAELGNDLLNSKIELIAGQGTIFV